MVGPTNTRNGVFEGLAERAGDDASPFGGPADRNDKHPATGVFEGLAERAGDDASPFGGPADRNDKHPAMGVFEGLAERAGFEPANLVGYTLSKRAR